MANQYAQIAFTNGVRNNQQVLGSRTFYQRFDEGETTNDVLGAKEVEFLEHRDSFYLATVNENGWPYLQHRGGPTGFVRVVDERSIGFSDFRGNRQFLSLSNAQHDDRVSLFFMDYPNRRRLKIFGHMSLALAADADTLSLQDLGTYRAKIDRTFIVKIAAFDWNCPQHITPRYSASEIELALPASKNLYTV
ncbi:MAG: pyridoxamine 5'-phosphate oxidase family protein [Gammaproteobacteria bacterium]